MNKVLAGAIAILTGFSAIAQADEPVPKRKPGLWEITTVAAGTGQTTIKACIGEDDDIATPSGIGECSKPTVERAGDTTIVTVVCKKKFGSEILSTAFTGDFDKHYHGIMKISFDPPEGVKGMGVIIDGKYLRSDCGDAATP